MGAAAGLRHVGVAEDDSHFLDRDDEKIGNDLRKTRFVPLPSRLCADDDTPDGGRDAVAHNVNEYLAVMSGVASDLGAPLLVAAARNQKP
jgi:hypothetical protein